MKKLALALILMAAMWTASSNPFGDEVVNGKVDGVSFVCTVRDPEDFDVNGKKIESYVTAYSGLDGMFVVIPFTSKATAHWFTGLYKTVYKDALDRGGAWGGLAERKLLEMFAPRISEPFMEYGFAVVLAAPCEYEYKGD